MYKKVSAIYFFGLFSIMLALLNGCAGALIGGTAALGVAAHQERTVGDAIDDATIRLGVLHNLFQKSETLFTKVGIEVVEARVLLTGVLPNPESRVEAVRQTWRVDGVREVLNEIEIGDAGNWKTFAKDTWITTQLRAILLQDKKIFDINYSLETINGVVYLLGIARDSAELGLVTDHARNIRGVQRVVSHVMIKDDPRRNPS